MEGKYNFSYTSLARLESPDQLTLGYAKSTIIKNGAELKSISLDELKEIPATLTGVAKNNLPANYVYTGTKGTFAPSNVVFVDIDTTTGADDVINKANDLFTLFPSIAFIQKSTSGKLHIVVKLPRLVQKEEDYKYWAALYTIATLVSIKKSTGVDYFEINKTENCIDDHSLKYTQALFISANPIIINPTIVASKLSDGTINSIIQSADVYGWNWFETAYVHTTSTQSETGEWDSDVEGNIILNIDKNFVVSGTTMEKVNGSFTAVQKSYSGNDLRWRIVVVLYNIFPEEEMKEFIKKHFVQAEEMIMSIPSIKNRKHTTPNSIVRDWLYSTFNITRAQSLHGDLCLNNEQYLSDIEANIVKLIDKSNCNCELIAPTGTGKTTLINSRECTQDLFGNAAVMSGIAFLYNAVVVVPYNATNSLYFNLESVNSSNNKDVNMKIIESGKPFVCVFDQFVKNYNLLKGRTIIVDEAHLLFTTRQWRDKAGEMLTILRDVEHKILFTATPEGEAELLGIPVYNIAKKERLINTHVIRFENAKARFIWEEKYIIDYYSDRYDTICFFDDTNNLKIADILTGGAYEFTHVRADMKESEKVKRLLDTELIEDKYIVSTNIGQQGLNFNNTGRICIVCSFEEGSDFVSDILQAVGRFRKASLIDLYVLVKERHSESAEEERDRVLKINKVYTENAIEEFNTTDQVPLENYDVIKELNEYRKVHSTIELLDERLSSGGFHKVEDRTKNEDGLTCRYEIKEKHVQDGKFVADLKNNCVANSSDNRYYKECITLYGRLQNLLSTDAILKLYEKKQDNCMFISFATALLDVYRFAQMSRGELEDALDKINDIMKKQKDLAVKDALKNSKRSIDRALTIQNNMTATNILDTDVFAAFYDMVEEEYNLVIEKKTEGGRKGGLKGDKEKKAEAGRLGSPKKRVIDDKGIEYSSCSECAKANGISNGLCTKRIKKGLYKYV